MNWRNELIISNIPTERKELFCYTGWIFRFKRREEVKEKKVEEKYSCQLPSLQMCFSCLYCFYFPNCVMGLECLEGIKSGLKRWLAVIWWDYLLTCLSPRRSSNWVLLNLPRTHFFAKLKSGILPVKSRLISRVSPRIVNAVLFLGPVTGVIHFKDLMNLATSSKDKQFGKRKTELWRIRRE